MHSVHFSLLKEERAFLVLVCPRSKCYAFICSYLFVRLLTFDSLNGVKNAQKCAYMRVLVRSKAFDTLLSEASDEYMKIESLSPGARSTCLKHTSILLSSAKICG